ncbi:peptidylprolyl isomerase [Paenibacillus athensensis]|uniref:peptidylprolyl isomerase n=1 Tax=Paenibacillus athensensis TaxID=1967502 RepID=A0A4Y8PUN9_9BACL|nr:peptidylprolyl isomerase [Paenibacillus athensensis]MCD1261866.1 peptidylprolyl isomerase [Paenibacillus athensensis]
MGNVKRLWGVIVVMAICIAALASWLVMRPTTGPGASASPTPSSQPSAQPEHPPVAATIGGKPILLTELEEALERQYGTELLNQLLDRAALRLEAAETATTVPDADIQRELKRMQLGYESEEQFYSSMKDQLNMTRDQLKEDVYYKLLLEKLATRGVKITDAEVDNYIQSHQDEFRTIKEYNLAQVILPTKEQAEKALAALAKGESFAIVARDRSLDDATANSGGDLGWIEEDDPFVEEPILTAAKQLKPGEVSQPVQVLQGYAIVKLKGRRDKANPEQPYIRDNVRKELALQQAPPLKDYVAGLREKWNAKIEDARFK